MGDTLNMAENRDPQFPNAFDPSSILNKKEEAPLPAPAHNNTPSDVDLIAQFPDLAPANDTRSVETQNYAPLHNDVHFQSRFASWIRSVALIVVCVFVPDQISWAFNYNPAIIFGARAPVMVQPGELPPAEMAAMQVSGSVDRLLKEVDQKKADRIELKLDNKDKGGQSLTINAKTKFSTEERTAIGKWLATPGLHIINCGVYALQDILAHHDLKKTPEELALLTIATDLLSNVIKPGDPKLKISLFSIDQALKGYGLNYGAARLKPVDVMALRTPFIAHFKEEHFGTVTGITDTEVA